MAIKDHLRNEDTYQCLTKAEAISAAADIHTMNNDWIKKWREEEVITKNELCFLNEKSQCESLLDSLSTFYVTMKVKKTPLKT